MAREGGCFCGAIRYRVDGEARQVTHCHCLHCRRTSGAPFVTWAEFALAGFVVTTGEPAHLETRPGVDRTFCRDCGSPLTFRDAETPASVDVTVATLDEPDAVAPRDHVWVDRRIAWSRIDDGLPRYRRRRRDGPPE